jgi:hypothetical protein
MRIPHAQEVSTHAQKLSMAFSQISVSRRITGIAQLLNTFLIERDIPRLDYGLSNGAYLPTERKKEDRWNFRVRAEPTDVERCLFFGRG